MVSAVKTLNLIFCHLVGDFVLQSDFIAKTKGENWYHLFVHCMLYSLPFYIVFGACWQIPMIVVSHFIIDAAKARYNQISYVADQCFHFNILWLIFWNY